MTKVTSADLQKHFGIYKREALSRPVEVTVHGKPTLMLMSYDFYQSLVEKKEIAAAEGADGDLGGPPRDAQADLEELERMAGEPGQVIFADDSPDEELVD